MSMLLRIDFSLLDALASSATPFVNVSQTGVRASKKSRPGNRKLSRPGDSQLRALVEVAWQVLTVVLTSATAS